MPEALKRHLPIVVFLFCGMLELLSYVGWHLPEFRMLMLVLLAMGAIALAFFDLRWLFAFVLIEGVIGSHGRLFFAPIGGFSLSLRMALFAILLVSWSVHAARGCARVLHFRHAHVSGPLLVLLAALTLAAVRGIAEGASFGSVFNDANGYAFLLLIPIGLDLFADRPSFAWLLRALSGAIAWLCVKSLLLLYLFSHDFSSAFLLDLFTWQRKFGLSEITHLGGGAERIFAASDVMLLPALFLGALLAWQHRSRGLLLWAGLAASAFILSLSRSFWLGALVSATFLLPVFIRFGVIPLQSFVRLCRTGLLALFGGALLLAAIALFPLPSVKGGVAAGDRATKDVSAWNAYGERATDVADASVSSRWNMIAPLQSGIASAPVLGSGFGAVITYHSDDLRMNDLYPGGRVTTGAIEWQYLEIWLKMGLLGLAAVVWLWWRIGLLFWKTIETCRLEDRLVVAGLMMSFLAFVVANIFTPYVNHPLGWMFLSFVIIGLHAAQEHDLPEHHDVPRPIALR